MRYAGKTGLGEHPAAWIKMISTGDRKSRSLGAWWEPTGLVTGMERRTKVGVQEGSKVVLKYF
jgi:hypothetical protein